MSSENEQQPASPQHSLRNSLAIFIVALALYSAPLGLSPFTSHGEAREAVVVKNMADQSTLILPLRNGISIPSKPPFFHWLSYFTAQGIGLNEFSVRFPSALAAAVSLALLFWIVSRYAGTGIAVTAALITGTAGEWMRSASLARVDMVFTAALMFSFVLSFEALERYWSRRRIPLLTALGLVLASAAAVLTKGPAGLVLPWAAAFLYAFLVQRRRLLPSFPYGAALLIVALAGVLAGLWYFAAYRVGGKAFVDVQLMKENVARLAGIDKYNVGHENPFYFSVVDLFTGFLPWSIFLAYPAVIVRRSRLHLEDPRHRLVVFCLSWVAIFIAVVSVASSKRTVYLLPVYPALGYLISSTLPADIFRELRSWKVAHGLVLAWLSLFALAGVLLPIGATVWLVHPEVAASFLKKAPAQEAAAAVAECLSSAPALFALAGIIVATLLISAARLAFRKRNTQAAQAFGAALLAVFVAGAAGIQPAIARRNSPAPFMAEVTRTVPRQTPLYFFEDESYPAIFYSDRNIPPLRDLPPVSELYLLAREQQVAEIQRRWPEAVLQLLSSGFADENKNRLALLRLKTGE